MLQLKRLKGDARRSVVIILEGTKGIYFVRCSQDYNHELQQELEPAKASG